MRERVFRWRQAFLTLVAFAVAVSTVNAENLDELRWKERVLLIYAPEGLDKQLARQEELLRSHDAELKERDVTQIVLQVRGEILKSLNGLSYRVPTLHYS